MAVLYYNDHYISVFLTPDKTNNSACVPFVEIRHKWDESRVARLTISEVFNTDEEAQHRGVEEARKWIDQRATKIVSHGLDGVGSKVGNERPAVLLGFKAWLAALFVKPT